jgi:DNA polymerase-3 subunit delta'
MQPWLLPYQQQFSSQFSRDVLPHAILVNGVTGSGKLAFSQWLLHLLSCQQPQQAVNNQVTYL